MRENRSKHGLNVLGADEEGKGDAGDDTDREGVVGHSVNDVLGGRNEGVGVVVLDVVELGEDVEGLGEE